MRILFACGGTGGHINPAIAVAKLIKERRPESDILFVGAVGGMEVELVPREGFPIETVDISNFRRSFKPKDILNNVRTVTKLLGSVSQAGKILDRFRPDAVVGTGGYASFPVVYAAARKGIKTAIHESNAVPGLTTTLLGKRAMRIMVSFEESRQYFSHKNRVVFTGTPVREAFIYTKPDEAKQKLGLSGKPVIVSYWGSLGAREMNKKIAAFMALESKDDAYHHIHATGSFGWRWMPDYVKDMGVDLTAHPNIDMREYIYDMPLVMAAADLVICRAGASTLSEVVAAQKPAIIVPSPNVAGNHQEKNARVLERAGAAVVLLEKDVDGDILFRAARDLLADEGRLSDIRKSLSRMVVLDSAERIYAVVTELAAKDKRDETIEIE